MKRALAQLTQPAPVQCWRLYLSTGFIQDHGPGHAAIPSTNPSKPVAPGCEKYKQIPFQLGDIAPGASYRAESPISRIGLPNRSIVSGSSAARKGRGRVRSERFRTRIEHGFDVAGDFVAGPSHTLPTGGAGRSFPGLTVDMFQRRTSLVRFDAKSLKKSIPAIAKFSEIEGLDAHGRSAAIRFE